MSRQRNQSVSQFEQVGTLCIEDHHLKRDDVEVVGESANVCALIVLNLFYLVRIGLPNILWKGNTLARACAQRLATHYFTKVHRQFCQVGDPVDSKTLLLRVQVVSCEHLAIEHSCQLRGVQEANSSFSQQ